jgi:hypothetical protein
VLARSGLRRLLCWRASRCDGPGRNLCRLGPWRPGRRCARSTRAAPASTLARVTVWREVARVPPQAAAAWPLLRSLSAGCAGFYAGARHVVARGGTCAASGGGGLAVAALARRGLRRLLRWRASRCGAGQRRLGRRCARSTRAAPASTLARVSVWREVARVPPQAAVAWPSPRSLGAGCAGFYAGARHGVARGGTCAASGGGGLAVAALARRGLRRLLRWRTSRCGAGRHVCRLRRRRLGRCCARSAGLRWLLRWRASRCGAGRHMCCLRRRRLGRRCARSARAALAPTLARVTVWREAARVPPQAAAAWPSLRSLGAGCAGSYAGARHGVARGGTCAATGGGGLAVADLAQRRLRQLLRWRASRCGAGRHMCFLRRRRLGRRCARSARAAPAPTLARVTAWREAAAARPPLRPLGAGCAGSYAGARHNVARGGTYAASGGGGLAVAALARRGQRWLLGWRASRCGAGRHMCRLRRRWLGRCCARSARAAPASTLARVTVWRDVARMPPQAAAAASPSLRSLGAGCPGSWAGARHPVAWGGTCAASRQWLGRCCARSARAAPLDVGSAGS